MHFDACVGMSLVMLWMDEILHFEVMRTHCLLVFPGNQHSRSSFRWCVGWISPPSDLAEGPGFALLALVPFMRSFARARIQRSWSSVHEMSQAAKLPSKARIFGKCSAHRPVSLGLYTSEYRRFPLVLIGFIPSGAMSWLFVFQISHRFLCKG